MTTKYYTFNGQRIALRDETGLTYLNADHLGSTALTTKGSGATLDDHGYNAYGKDRRGSELRTAQRFTGQPGDATGLLYYVARYYDPQLGQFISPDSLVPDATNLFDYNRYMYARGNPIRYTDPDGHCATLPSGSPDGNDGECWRYANTIVAQWDNTPDYWNNRFTSKDVLSHYVAANGSNHADFFQATLTQYLKSDTFKAWDAQQSKPFEYHDIQSKDLRDATAVGLSVSGQGVLAGTGGVELIVTKNGETAIFVYLGPGGAIGGGANAKVYVADIFNLKTTDSYAGWAGVVDSTVSLGLVGGSAGAFTSLPLGGARGQYFGFAPGADVSASGSAVYYFPAVVNYNSQTNQWSSPLLGK